MNLEQFTCFNLWKHVLINRRCNYGMRPSCFEMLYLLLQLLVQTMKDTKYKLHICSFCWCILFWHFDKSKHFRGFNKEQNTSVIHIVIDILYCPFYCAFSLYIQSTVFKVKWIFYDIIIIMHCPNEETRTNNALKSGCWKCFKFTMYPKSDCYYWNSGRRHEQIFCPFYWVVRRHQLRMCYNQCQISLSFP